MFPVPKHEWWFCNKANCHAPDRVYGQQAQFLARMWLEQLRADPLRLNLLRDLMRSKISIDQFQGADSSLARQVEAMLATGKLHLHKKPYETTSGSYIQDDQPAFPLANRPPRDSSPAPAPVDPPSFPPNVSLAQIAVVLASAARAGAPFCEE